MPIYLHVFVCRHPVLYLCVWRGNKYYYYYYYYISQNDWNYKFMKGSHALICKELKINKDFRVRAVFLPFGVKITTN